MMSRIVKAATLLALTLVLAAGVVLVPFATTQAMDQPSCDAALLHCYDQCDWIYSHPAEIIELRACRMGCRIGYLFCR